MNKEGYVPKEQRKKVLLITDDIRSNSGVGNVGREFVLQTAHHYNFACIAGSINHPEVGKRLDLSQDTNTHAGINDAYVNLYPTNGYGDANLVRQLIKLEKPDIIFLITDPRYFIWLFQIENEIRKKGIKICYLNIWDSPTPYPIWNQPYYQSCDLLMGISKQTVNINKVVLDQGNIAWNEIEGDIDLKADKKEIFISYVPHGINEGIFKPISEGDVDYPKLVQFKKDLFRGKEYDFVLFFNSRNIRRKQVADTILAYKLFIDQLSIEKAKKCAIVLHTQIVDDNGTDLEAVREYLLDGEQYNLIFSDKPLPPDYMNLLYNSSDCQILLTSNEGWGLSLTEALLVGKPIIANVQGGMQDQMRFEDENGKWINFSLDFPSNHRGTYLKHGEWAFPVFPSNISIQGSPMTPYISDDRCRPEDAALQIFKVYNLPKDERKKKGLAGREWALSKEAGLTAKKMGERIILAIDKTIDESKPREKYELVNAINQPNKSIKHKFIY